MKVKLNLLICFCCSMGFFSAFGQNQRATISDSLKLIPKRYRTTSISDSASKIQFIQRALLILQNNGYLNAQLMVSDSNAKIINYQYYLGQPYNLQLVKHDTANIRLDIKKTTPLKPRQYAQQIDKQLVELANNGFPFGQIERKVLNDSAGYYLITQTVNSGPKIKIDSIRFVGSNKVKAWFLSRHLGIQPGSWYSQSLLNQVPSKINTLPFLAVSQVQQLFFYGESAVLYLFLKDAPVNNFDGMVGFFPNAGIEGRLQLTGDISLQLFNAFKQGEQLAFNWRNLGQGTQDLKLKTHIPYWFGSAFGHELDFRLFKRDSLFIEVNSRLAIQVTYKSNQSVQAYYQIKDFLQLGNSTDQIARSGASKNITINYYGLSWQINKLNRFQNPTNGIFFRLQAAAGNRYVRPNGIDALNLAIDTPQNSVSYNIVWQLESYKKIGQRVVLAAQTNADMQFNTSYFQNEFTRFGGFKSLKGFDEESLNAARVIWFNLEPRLLLDDGTYLYLFYNQAFTFTPTRLNLPYDNPFGFGAGLTFTNKTGIFSLAYAVGSQLNNPISFRAAKVHFGYRYLLQ